MPTFFATIVTGLEDVAAKEVESILGCKAKPDVGKVFFECDIRDAVLLNFTSRCLHKIFLLLERGTVSSLEDVARLACNVDYSELILPSQSFAVRVEKHGEHALRSLDIAAVVGRSVIESYLASRNVRLAVNLDNPDVELYALLRDNELLLGLNTTGQSLHRRFYKVFHHRASLMPTIACSMILLSGWEPNESLLDPMCGSGTILVEAALVARRIAPGLRRGDLALEKLCFINKEVIEEVRQRLLSNETKVMVEIHGIDASPKSVDGALANATKAGVVDTVSIRVGDALNLVNYIREPPSHIITNPPYGIRMDIRNIERFYERFLTSVKQAAPHAIITMITSRLGLVRRIAEALGMQITDVRQLLYGRIQASIIKLVQ
ncbi:MAG: tRNA (guanine(6)-N2)-methyltransferase [Nitrososphaerota archaeon]